MTKPENPAAGTSLLFIDAIDGDSARLLLGEQAFDFPTRLLPDGAKEGTWLYFSLKRAAPPPDEGAALRRKLGQDDDGGDIKL